MAFWNLSDETKVEDTKEYEAPSGGGDYIFSDGSKVAAVIDEIKWHSFEGGERFINVRWSVLAPETDADGVKIANRKVFQKIYVNGDAARAKDEEKRKKKADNAKRMLGAMAANAGGGLLKLAHEPTDDDFATHMLMKPMTISLGVWEMETNGEKRKGNWVRACGPYNANMPVIGGAPKPVAKAQVHGGAQKQELDDDIPW